MDRLDFEAARSVSRRRLLTAGISGGAALIAARALGADVDLRLPGGNSARPLTSDFPQKGEMILQRLPREKVTASRDALLFALGRIGGDSR